jgi:hypothetical protein
MNMSRKIRVPIMMLPTLELTNAFTIIMPTQN